MILQLSTTCLRTLQNGRKILLLYYPYREEGFLFFGGVLKQIMSVRVE